MRCFHFVHCTLLGCYPQSASARNSDLRQYNVFYNRWRINSAKISYSLVLYLALTFMKSLQVIEVLIILIKLIGIIITFIVRFKVGVVQHENGKRSNAKHHQHDTANAVESIFIHHSCCRIFTKFSLKVYFSKFLSTNCWKVHYCSNINSSNVLTSKWHLSFAVTEQLPSGRKIMNEIMTTTSNSLENCLQRPMFTFVTSL